MNASAVPLSTEQMSGTPCFSESFQSLERLRYLEEMIEHSTKEELSYALKLLALIMATSDEGKMYLEVPGSKPKEADIIYGLVLHASIALENAKKGEDPVRQLLQSIKEQESKEKATY